MDDIDRKILAQLQRDSSKRMHQLAKILGLPATTIHNRIKKLEKNRVIKGYKALVSYAGIGKAMCVMVHVVISSKESVREVAEQISRKQNVEEVFVVAGQYDIIAKIRLKDASDLSRFIFDPKQGLRSWPGVERTESMIVLDTIKENGVVEPA